MYFEQIYTFTVLNNSSDKNTLLYRNKEYSFNPFTGYLDSTKILPEYVHEKLSLTIQQKPVYGWKNDQTITIED